MNWGKRILVLYLGFVALIISLAITCFGQTSELESKDYYARELKFQDQLDATNRANALPVSVTHVVNEHSVELSFPQDVLTPDFRGTVNFFRPSDSSKDKRLELHLTADGKQFINDPGFIRGVYRMQISFFSHGKMYYKEDVINFQ